MSVATSVTAATVTLPPPSNFLRRFCRNGTAMVASVILVLVVLIAIFAPELAPHDPARSSLRNILKPPSATYPLAWTI
jgi:ABC-type antimicrobial peptide transport system permease subunit